MKLLKIIFRKNYYRVLHIPKRKSDQELLIKTKDDEKKNPRQQVGNKKVMPCIEIKKPPEGYEQPYPEEDHVCGFKTKV